MKNIFKLILLIPLLAFSYGQYTVPFSTGANAGSLNPLFGKWLINEGTTATVALDSSGHSNNATWFGTQSCTGSYYTTGLTPLTYSGCLDGSTNYLNVGNVSPLNFDRTQAFTISAWINIPASETGIIISKLDTASPNSGWEFLVAGTGIQLYIVNTFGSNAISVNGGTITTGTKTNVCATYDGSSTAAGTALYVNGSAVTKSVTQDSLSASILNTIPVHIGARGTSFPFQGTLADVRVYNSVVSCAAINTAGPGG